MSSLSAFEAMIRKDERLKARAREREHIIETIGLIADEWDLSNEPAWAEAARHVVAALRAGELGEPRENSISD